MGLRVCLSRRAHQVDRDDHSGVFTSAAKKDHITMVTGHEQIVWNTGPVSYEAHANTWKNAWERCKKNFYRFEGGEVETEYFLTLFAVLRIAFSTVREALESSNIVAMKE